MLSDRIPWSYSILAFAGGCLLTGFTLSGMEAADEKPANTVVQATTPAPAGPARCDLRTMRIKGYAGIAPLLATERECESPRLVAIRTEVARLVADYQAKGVLTTASFYLRDLEHGEWTVYNDGERFAPGSLLKVPVMMTYLRASEYDPQVLRKSYTLRSHDYALPYTFFPPKDPIVVGQAYSVPDLIHHSISRSDNWAHLLLLLHVDQQRFIRLFEDLSLPRMDPSGAEYPMGARDYSMFMKALFNASYLNTRDSEFAVAQLAASDFDKGLRAGVPSTVRMAHKFGESGDDRLRQLHESAIVYLEGSPYVLTVMTKGQDMERLPQVLSRISDLVYHRMAQR